MVGLTNGHVYLHNYPPGSTGTDNFQAHTGGSVWDIKLINNVTAVTCYVYVRVWNLIDKTMIKEIVDAHDGEIIRAIEVLREDVVVTTGEDRKVKVNIIKNKIIMLRLSAS